MTQWQVSVLDLGKITARLSMVWPAGMPPLEEDFELSAPYLGFLLRRNGRRILIDSGISEKFIVDGRAWGFLPAEGGSDFLIEALKKAQKDTDDQQQQRPPPPSTQPSTPQDPPLIDVLAEIRMIRALQMRVNRRTQRYSKLIEGEQAQEPELVEALQQLAEREARIHRVTRDLAAGRNK